MSPPTSLSRLPPAPIQKEVLRDKLTDRLREWILDGTLKPGDRIVEYVVARQLGVSRAPLREAIWMLARQGLVRLEAHHGAYVASLSARDIREIFAIRRALETEAARAVAQAAPPEAGPALRDMMKQMRAAAADRDMRRWSEVDHEFHRTLWRLSGSRHLEEVLGDLSARFFGYELIRDAAHGRAFRFDPMTRLHQRMVDLTLAGDAAAITSGFDEIFAEFLRYVLARFGEE